MSDKTDALYFSERRLWEDGSKQIREVLERLARYRASQDRTVAELAALRKGLQGEVERHREAAKEVRETPDFESLKCSWPTIAEMWEVDADRLQELLDAAPPSSGGK